MLLFYSFLGLNADAGSQIEPAPVELVEEAPSETAPADLETAALTDVDALAGCLADKGAKLYGAYWCGHCAQQKAMFGEGIKYVTYIECDSRGENADPSACTAAGIEAFPTWILADGTKLIGTQQLETLAVKTAC